MNKEEYNTELRERLKKFRENNFNPSLTTIAKLINMNGNQLRDWNRGLINSKKETLARLDKFLKKYEE
ncbi:hypothetical protein [Macrococcoides caseolyticum]|uniref:hypothetical protein n=1 Tax=Macrococcoides caseolyticum TaxID=69966 RepID=UPI001F254521|nr:hypothetical protein [Macrococcus caseolyticus]MCE4956734.1 hypothetical protein [Macrococcus caseolyticus]